MIQRLNHAKTSIGFTQLIIALITVNTETVNKPNFWGWMDDLRFYILFNSISVISGQCVDDNERLCAVEPCL